MYKLCPITNIICVYSATSKGEKYCGLGNKTKLGFKTKVKEMEGCPLLQKKKKSK